MSADIVVGALELIGLGFEVVPLVGKDPSRTLGRRWPELGTRDPALVQQWPDLYPGLTGVGVLCGLPSNVIVVDVDPRHGGDDELARLEAEHGPLPEGPEVMTGGGGRHLYFAPPATMPSSVRHGLGLEVKASGQVVAPPSIHPVTRRPYGWRRHPAEIEMPIVVAWLLTPTRASGNANGVPRRVRTLHRGIRHCALVSLAGSMS